MYVKIRNYIQLSTITVENIFLLHVFHVFFIYSIFRSVRIEYYNQHNFSIT